MSRLSITHLNSGENPFLSLSRLQGQAQKSTTGASAPGARSSGTPPFHSTSPSHQTVRKGTWWVEVMTLRARRRLGHKFTTAKWPRRSLFMHTAADCRVDSRTFGDYVATAGQQGCKRELRGGPQAGSPSGSLGARMERLNRLIGRVVNLE